MVKKQKQKIVKITEIAPRIKEINSKSGSVKENKKESRLEVEVEDMPISSESFSSVSNVSPAPNLVLKSDEPEQIIERPLPAPVQQRPEPEFSQTRTYTTRPQFEDFERANRRYVSPEESVRRIDPTITSSSVAFSSENQSLNFGNRQASAKESMPERDYSESLSQQQDKPKRKYPWEA